MLPGKNWRYFSAHGLPTSNPPSCPVFTPRISFFGQSQFRISPIINSSFDIQLIFMQTTCNCFLLSALQCYLRLLNPLQQKNISRPLPEQFSLMVIMPLRSTVRSLHYFSVVTASNIQFYSGPSTSQMEGRKGRFTRTRSSPCAIYLRMFPWFSVIVMGPKDC